MRKGGTCRVRQAGGTRARLQQLVTAARCRPPASPALSASKPHSNRHTAAQSVLHPVPPISLPTPPPSSPAATQALPSPDRSYRYSVRRWGSSSDRASSTASAGCVWREVERDSERDGEGSRQWYTYTRNASATRPTGALQPPATQPPSHQPRTREASNLQAQGHLLLMPQHHTAAGGHLGHVAA